MIKDPKNPPQQDILLNFINEGQNPLIVRDVYSKIQSMLTVDEHVVNIFIQHKLIGLNASLIVTNWRLFIHKPIIIGGANIESFLWRLLGHPRIDEGPIYATFTIETRFEPIKRSSTSFLPKLQALRLYALAKEQADWWDEEHRLRNLELQRAASGGLVLKGGLTGMAEQPHPVMPLPHAPFPFHTPLQPWSYAKHEEPPLAGPALRPQKIEEPAPPKPIQEEPPQEALPMPELIPDDPLEKLRQLKELLDSNLISRDEYNAKRKEILDKI
ncbi:MAG: SHOCT domain-containing protein [Verrucomicrobiota bacterium]